MHVLNLVTTHQATFFKQQVCVLGDAGVESTTLAVPGRDITDGEVDSRSVTDYLRFYPPVLRHSFGQYDLIHANNGLTAPAALAQPNLPVVLSLWGTDLMGRYGPMSRLCARGCDAVVVMSDEMRRALGRDCRVIPHGVDLSLFAPQSQSAARATLGWSERAHQVLFPYPRGRAVKNYPRAARVVAAAQQRLDRPVELQTISGVPHDRMPVYMNAADTLLVTSHREGSPNAVKEAMACDCPVVSTDVGDVSDRLDGVSPSFVCRSDDQLVDALVTVLSGESRSNGRAHVADLSLERMGERLVDVYRSVVDTER